MSRAAWQTRNVMNQRTHVAGAYAIKPPETASGLVIRTAPDGVVEHFLNGVQVSSEVAAAYQARAVGPVSETNLTGAE